MAKNIIPHYTYDSLTEKLTKKRFKSLRRLPAEDSYVFKIYDRDDERRFTSPTNERQPPKNGQIFLAVGIRIGSSVLYVDKRAAQLRGTGETVWARITYTDSTNDIVLRSHGRDLDPRQTREVELDEPFLHVVPEGATLQKERMFKSLVLYIFVQCGHITRVGNLKEKGLRRSLSKAVKEVRLGVKNQSSARYAKPVKGNDFPETRLVPKKPLGQMRVKSTASSRNPCKRESSTDDRLKQEKSAFESGHPAVHDARSNGHGNQDERMKNAMSPKKRVHNTPPS